MTYRHHAAIGRLKTHASTLRWLGLAFLAVGCGALIAPAIAALAVELMIGWLLVAIGLSGAIAAWSMRASGFVKLGLIPILLFAVGMIFVLRPETGIAALATTVAIVFLVEGVASVAAGWALKRTAGVGNVVLASGAVAILVAILMLFGWPASAKWIVGILVGANFLSSGIGLLAISKIAADAAARDDTSGRMANL